jgi:hypothetical protein
MTSGVTLKKTFYQPHQFVRNPPIKGPTVSPVEAMEKFIPRIFPRSELSKTDDRMAIVFFLCQYGHRIVYLVFFYVRHL